MTKHRCTHRIHHDGLRCVLKAGHKYGHVYQSSQTDDRHAPD